MSDIQTKIDEVRLQAREVCAEDPASTGKNALLQYCDDNPDAAECRLYED
jgi:CP12 domain